ncbi:M23 family metallopeptidase [Devosia albogilva]|uniref:M23 family metallopeptidase n=2 Tax=Devosia albogilva TaxID=429726 RepID=A0ABW5QQV5_9HYPH
MQARSSFEQARASVGHRIHPALFYSMFVLLLGGNALLGTALLLHSDIARLWSGKTDQIISAYEDRIAELRVEIDRLHSRNYAQAGDMNLQLQELAQQQEVLLEQHQLVKVLVDKADALGIAPAATPTTAAITVPTTASGNPDIAATAASIDQMMTETRSAMASIASTASERTEGIVSTLTRLGIPVTLPPVEEGVGGPLLAPVEDAALSPAVEDANAVLAALIRYQAARQSIDAAPVHMPISDGYRQSSGFGNRKDPFTGSRAFHAGLDFAAPSGTSVFSAAAGVVTFVGQKSGYGKTVEVTHSSGFITRYGHLSAYMVEKDQRVNTGTPIAKVGSTGRSTGPHLHFEVRRNDTALNPKEFLEAGRQLLALI